MKIEKQIFSPMTLTLHSNDCYWNGLWISFVGVSCYQIWLTEFDYSSKSFIINHDEREQMRSERKKTNMSDVS